MSKRIDQERAEDRREARIECGKERLRLAQLVLTAYAEGLGIAETAARIGKAEHTVWQVRVWLGVQSGRQWRAGGGTTGRLNTRKALEGVCP